WLAGQRMRLDDAVPPRSQRRAVGQAPAAVLQRMPGVGPVRSRPLLAQWPACGPLGHKPVAAWVGEAPLHRDSGTLRSQRRGGGELRAGERRSTWVATRENPVLTVLYQRLLATGNLKQVAVIACMHKLWTILNAMVRDLTPWLLREVSIASHPRPP